jgi:hypothetical protein
MDEGYPLEAVTTLQTIAASESRMRDPRVEEGPAVSMESDGLNAELRHVDSVHHFQVDYAPWPG